MPQFKYSFRGAAHLYPVFIQLLASVFVACGLLAKGHPAMRYGSSDVKKYRFGDLVGEAWYHLRRSRATPRQWAMYFSVLIMIFCFATAIVGITSRVFLGMGTAAQAQLFTLGATNTSIQAGLTASPSTLFDKRMDRLQGGGMGVAYNDWGLFMLDKIVRESAMTPQRGGALQNAFSAIILTYNTAITVIAAVMIFWIILVVVVDTAKTGVLGGGRHNMVWAPIRIVFALGLMIPLGTAGYSSGQYCVMKLAEWGSNLGTNGWKAYVGALSGNGNDFLAPVMPGGSAGLVNAVAEQRLCQVTYNAFVVKATQPPDTRQLVGAVNTWMGGNGTLQHTLTNQTDMDLCGALQISAPGGLLPVTFAGAPAPTWTNVMAEPRMGDVANRNPTDAWTGTGVQDDTSQVALASTLAGAAALGMTGLGGWTWGAQWSTLGGNPIAAGVQAVSFQTAQMTMRQKVVQGVINSLTLKVEPLMLKFACAYAGHHAVGIQTGPTNLVNNAVDNDGATKLCTVGWTDTGCGATALPPPPGPASGAYDPDYSCHSQAITDMQNDLGTQLSGGVALILAWLAPGGSLAPDMTQYGWASAGAFYNKVTSMNASVQALAKPSITYLPGKLGNAAANCGNSYASIGECVPAKIDYETAMVMQLYTKWYEKKSGDGQGSVGGLGQNGNTSVNNAAQAADKPNGMSMWNLAWGMIKGGQTAVMALIRTALGLPDNRNGFLVNLVGDVSDNTLPLANLAKTGIGLSLMGGGMLVAASLLQGAIGAPIAGISLAQSMIWSFISGTAASLILSGMMLTFFVPIMPFLRSAFATLTWMVSIFEAVCMIPIAALAHLTTEGEGLAAGARQCWVLWLNVLVRPILFVMGFIGAFIVYNAFVCYFTVAFSQAAANSPTSDNIILAMVALFFNSAVYVGTCYAAANSVFKMVDIIPNALMRWMPGGSVDHSFDDGAQAAQGYAQSAASTVSRGMGDGAATYGKYQEKGWDAAAADAKQAARDAAMLTKA